MLHRIERRSTLQIVAESLSPTQQGLVAAGIGVTTGLNTYFTSPSEEDQQRIGHAIIAGVTITMLSFLILRANDDRERS